jgi:hypothetical protein
MSEPVTIPASNVHPSIRSSVERLATQELDPTVDNGAFLEVVKKNGTSSGTFALVHRTESGKFQAEAFVGTEDLTKPVKKGQVGLRAAFKW